MRTDAILDLHIRLLDNQHSFSVINDWARHTPWLHGFMRLYAGDGIVLFAVLLIAGWWLARRVGDARRMALALWAPAGTATALGVNQPIAHLVQEQRPFVAIPHVLQLVPQAAGASFPSAHATMAGAVAAGVLLVSWRLGLLAAPAALLMAFARVYVGVHYPGDVLAGLAFGAAVVSVGRLVAVPLLTRAVEWLQHARLRSLVTTRTPVVTTPTPMVTTGIPVGATRAWYPEPAPVRSAAAPAVDPLDRPGWVPDWPAGPQDPRGNGQVPSGGAYQSPGVRGWPGSGQDRPGSHGWPGEVQDRVGGDDGPFRR